MATFCLNDLSTFALHCASMPARHSRADARRSRVGVGVPLIPLDAAAAVPLYEQLYLGLRDQISRGVPPPGGRLASTRALATGLGVSRFTVVSAMERLLAEGYLTTHRGAGTFVVDTLPEQVMRPSRRAARPAHSARSARHPETSRTATSMPIEPVLSTRGRTLSAVVITGPRMTRDEPRPFRPRRPALDVFPLRRWARLIGRQWRTFSHTRLDYGEPAGYRPLRAAIAEHIALTRGLRCGAEQVVVTSGAQQAFDILFRLLIDPGDRVWMEEPGYLDVRAALVGAGASLVPVRVDEQGLDVAHGIREAGDAKLAVVSPSHQYPTGATLSASRRAALLEWSRGAGAWVVEDDYDSYFRYRGRPFSALQRSDMDMIAAQGASPRVLYVGTFSKTMFPSLRLGFCVVPPSLVDAVANARAIADRNSPIADQAALAAFIAEGDYDRHLRRLRLVYQERYEAMREHFARHLRGMITLAPAHAGTHVLAWPDATLIDDQQSGRWATRISRAAAEEGLVVFPLSRYCLDPPGRDALVLGYGGLTPDRIATGAQRLARVIAHERRVNRPRNAIRWRDDQR
jgi:GntR family transcriptional regulator / MocR family aminotransferase